MRAPKKKPTEKLRPWRVSLMRSRSQLLGVVYAPDQKSAEAAAVAEYKIGEDMRRRLIVRPDDSDADPQTRPHLPPSGQWRDEDYDVLENGVVVGRIFLSPAAPQDRQWMWASGHSAASISSDSDRYGPSAALARPWCAPRVHAARKRDPRLVCLGEVWRVVMR